MTARPTTRLERLERLAALNKAIRGSSHSVEEILAASAEIPVLLAELERDSKPARSVAARVSHAVGLVIGWLFLAAIVTALGAGIVALVRWAL